VIHVSPPAGDDRVARLGGNGTRPGACPRAAGKTATGQKRVSGHPAHLLPGIHDRRRDWRRRRNGGDAGVVTPDPLPPPWLPLDGYGVRGRGGDASGLLDIHPSIEQVLDAAT